MYSNYLLDVKNELIAEGVPEKLLDWIESIAEQAARDHWDNVEGEQDGN